MQINIGGGAICSYTAQVLIFFDGFDDIHNKNTAQRKEERNMGELAVRRENGFSVPRYQGVDMTEKQTESGEIQDTQRTERTGKTVGFTVSETLRQLMTGTSQAEVQTRESRRTLQMGEAVLDEVKDSLDRLAELARQSAEGEEPDRAALQKELEHLREGIERILGSAVSGDVKLFLDGGMDATEGAELLEEIRELLEQAPSDSGALDRLVELLTGGKSTSYADFQLQYPGDPAEGLQELLLKLLTSNSASLILNDSALLTLLDGMEGTGLNLLMNLLAAAPNTQAAPETSETAPSQPASEPASQPQAGRPAVPETGNAEETARATETVGKPTPAVEMSVKTFGAVQVLGRDLSGVSFNEVTGELTVNGSGEVTIRGDGQGTILLAGSGKVTLQNLTAAVITTDSSEVSLVSLGENAVGQLRIKEGTSLTVEGGGLLRLERLEAGKASALRLNGGGVAVAKKSEPLTVPIRLDGSAFLAAQAVNVRDASGKAEPFDVVWKTLIPSWGGAESMEVDGRRMKLALLNGEPIRLWLDRGNPGYTVHTLTVYGKDQSGRPRTRYAYLHWNPRTGAYEEISMYPNPFTVTGGEPGRDWVYEEGTQTLSILAGQVAAVSGGAGTDARQEPFSGRIVLADGIGGMELKLSGVSCRVSWGKAFDLGRENDVVLTLQSGTHNFFESGAGFPGISLGEGTSLCINCTDPDGEGDTSGTLTATGGEGSTGIGWDGIGKRGRAGRVLIRGGAGLGMGKGGFKQSVTVVGGMSAPLGEDGNMGVSLQIGGDSVTLPQVRLSSRMLQLDLLSVETLERAQAARVIIDADRRWVSQLQEAYSALYSQLEQSFSSLDGVQRYLNVAESLVRDSAQAGTLLEDMRQALLLQPEQALLTHGKQAAEDARQLLR